MKALPAVVGLIQARNEWPLLALSISHALMHHVDEVYVLNHSSTDGTREGVKKLREMWQGRVHVVNYWDDHFWQEACLSALLEVSQSSAPDWIYVFDADEFLIAREGESLKEILAGVETQYSVVRYQVQNWVSTQDFDETDLACYKTLRYRSVPNLFVEMDAAIYVDEILSGNLNYFDVPFASKVIFRNNAVSWVAAGTHAPKVPSEMPILDLPTDTLRLVHLPFLSHGRLLLKARHGQLMVQDGFPTSHGWQSQMTWSLSQEGRLDRFWQSHSIASCDGPEDRTLPSIAVDDGFAEAIEPTLRLLEGGLGPEALQRIAEQDMPLGAADTQIPFRAAVSSARRLQLIAEQLCQQRDALRAERDALRAEREALRAEDAAFALFWMRRFLRFLRARRRLSGQ